MRSTEKPDPDVVIVGGGPCGLALAIGMRQLGYGRVVVVERCAEAVDDWSRAYSYRLDCRGLRLMKRIGLLDEIKRRGIESTGFSRTAWKPDGSMEKKPGMSLGSVGYWLQRPQLIELMRRKAAAAGVELLVGDVTEVRFDDAGPYAVLKVEVGVMSGRTCAEKQQLRCRLLFGCDGMNSIVRTALERIDPAFGTSAISSPSAGLVFRAMLCTNPDGVETTQGVGVMSNPMAKGTSMFGVRNAAHAESLAMLPFAGDPTAPRPIGCARPCDNWLFRCATAEEVYEKLDALYPQLQARKRLEPASVEAWVAGTGSTFPRPRWARRAVRVAHGGAAAAAILGDALHTFPPDLGQGVNAGLEDVETLLSAIELEQGTPEAAVHALTAWGPERTLEAEAICRLLPIGFPYQYAGLPLSARKVAFLAGFLTRFGLFKLLERLRNATGAPNLLHAPVVVLIQQDPPLAYSSILAAHRYNSRVLLALGLATVAVALGALGRVGALSWA